MARSLIRERLGTFGAAVYWGVSIGAWAAYFYATYLQETQHPPPAWVATINRNPGIVFEWATRWSNDTVLQGIVETALVVIGISFIPGVLVVGLYLAGFVIVLAFLAAFVKLYYSLLALIAAMSTTGLVLAVILGIVPPAITIRWVVRRFGARIKRLVLRVVDPIYGIFFDWWLTPILLERRARRREREIMDDAEKKHDRMEQALARVKKPEIVIPAPNVPAPRTDDTWIERVVERFNDRGRQKNREEKIKLQTQERRYYTEARGAIDEYRKVLESADDLKRTVRGDTFKEKDEEAELRGLDRAKRKLTLEKDIAELKKVPEPPQSPPRKDTLAEALGRIERERREAIATNPGEADTLNRYFDDKKMKIMEGR